MSYRKMLRREWMQAAMAAAQHAHEQMAQAPGARKLRYFTAAEAGRVSALASVIIPSDEGAGATEAGVVYFIDALLAEAGEAERAVYRTGLLSQALAKEGEPFFEMVRTHTVMGFLSANLGGIDRDGGDQPCEPEEHARLHGLIWWTPATVAASDRVANHEDVNRADR